MADKSGEVLFGYGAGIGFRCVSYFPAMKPNPDLHLLIKSLSKSEKRYFKIFAGKQGGEGKTEVLKMH